MNKISPIPRLWGRFYLEGIKELETQPINSHLILDIDFDEIIEVEDSK